MSRGVLRTWWSVNQVNVLVNEVLIPDQQESKGSATDNIAYNSTTGIYTIQPNRIYMPWFNIGWTHPVTVSRRSVELFDTASIAGSRIYFAPVATAADENNQSLLATILAPTSEMTFDVRVSEVFAPQQTDVEAIHSSFNLIDLGAAADVSYLVAGRATNPATLVDGLVIDWDTNVRSGGPNVPTLDTDTGVITLPANRTWLVYGTFQVTHAGSYAMTFRGYDNTAAAEIIGTRTRIRGSGNTGLSLNMAMTTIIAPTVQTEIDCRVYADPDNAITANCTLQAAYSRMIVADIGAAE